MSTHHTRPAIFITHLTYTNVFYFEIIYMKKITFLYANE